MNAVPPPLHERIEFVALRDRIAEQLMRELTVDHLRAWEIADKIAPVAYLAVEVVCQQWQAACIDSAHTVVKALDRLGQMDPVIRAAQAYEATTERHPHSAAALDLVHATTAYNAIRAKDN